ncbi:MAG TPA: PAS domain-containing protein [Tepidisphaeraceae bacterium]|nr:PAS domain-containing protein [Tepidisphaeraceae bacterium]
MKAPLPENEAARLKALQAYRVLDTAPEQSFDDLTFLAAQICGTPIALITLVDAQRQWFKSKVGLDVPETARDISFCAHTILQPDVLEVPDATRDPRFVDNPLVQSNPDIRFYAGASLMTPLGGPLGTICVIDREPRQLTDAQRESLKALSRQVVAQLELRRHLIALTHSVALHEQAEEQLRRRTGELEAVLDALPYQYLRLGKDGSILGYNTRCGDVCHLPPGVFMGRPLHEALGHKIAGRFEEALTRSLRDRVVVDIEYTQPLPAGQRYFEARLSPFFEDQAIAIVRDVTARKLAEQTDAKAAQSRLFASKAELKALLTSITDVVLILDGEGRYLKVASGAADQLLYRPPEQLIGRTLHEVFPRSQADLLLGFIRQALATQRTTHADYSLLINGVERWFAANISPMTEGHVVWIARDITERKQSEKELREAKEAAERANSAKDRFLAILSHELRTPLTPVLASVAYLDNQPNLREDMREPIQVIRRNVELESRLIDDLLDLTRIARGKLQLHMDVVDMHAVIQNALDICRDAILSKELQVTVQLAARKHHVRGDPARLQQVLWNLLNNAAKYTPPGGGITVRTDNDSAERMRIQVADTGIGIEPSMLGRIFNAFEQIDNSKGSRAGGLGLGLTICRAVVESHGGRIEAASPGPNGGSTFTVTLATIEPVRRQPRITPSVETVTPSKELRLLLVEDHPDTARILTKLLQVAGHQVATAGGVQAALKVLSEQPVDLIISDLGLPDGSGLDLMRQAKAQYGLQGIAISGYGMEADIRRSHEAGFVEHLTKPISLQSLESAIHHASPQPS